MSGGENTAVKLVLPTWKRRVKAVPRASTVIPVVSQSALNVVSVNIVPVWATKLNLCVHYVPLVHIIVNLVQMNLAQKTFRSHALEVPLQATSPPPNRAPPRPPNGPLAPGAGASPSAGSASIATGNSNSNGCSGTQPQRPRIEAGSVQCCFR